MYLDGFCKFVVILIKKNYPSSKMFGPKNQFLAISQNTVSSQKSDYFNRFLVEFPF